MLEISSYFDKSLELEIGDKLLIPCSSKGQQNSIRTQLNRMRRLYAKRVDVKIMEYLGVSGQEINDKLYVVIERRKEIDDAFILKHNGTTEEIKIEGET